MSTAAVGTLAKRTELGGDYKLYVITATIAATSDAITLTQATHGISEIAGVVGAVITAGMDADFQHIQVSYSLLVLTVLTKQADGAASDEFTGTTVSITLLGKSE